jgi:hypothetical protein
VTASTAGVLVAPRLRCGIVLCSLEEDACQVLAGGEIVSVRYAPQFPAPRRERVLPGHLVAVAEAPGDSGVVVWRWYDAVVLGSDAGSIRLWEPAHGEVAARRRRPEQRYGPGTRAYLSAGLPGTTPTMKAIVDIDPRTALIDLYVQDLTGSSIQGWKDLARCRDALGITGGKLGDSDLQAHQDCFNARHEVVHELDLTDPSGKGTRGRRHRDIAAVGRQCDDALQLLYRFIALPPQQSRPSAGLPALPSRGPKPDCSDPAAWSRVISPAPVR